PCILITTLKVQSHETGTSFLKLILNAGKIRQIGFVFGGSLKAFSGSQAAFCRCFHALEVFEEVF
ncbi:MAG: hypothetical protein ACK56F_28135, partial [bacterium]